MRPNRWVVALVVTLAASAWTSPARAYDIGEVDAGNSVLQLVIDTKFEPCSRFLRDKFRAAYQDEGNYIRSHFSGGYNIGSPITRVTTPNPGFNTSPVRWYQLYSGTWGISSLTQQTRRAWWDIQFCFARPHLVTGAIYRRWGQIGHVNRLGGPTQHQWRMGAWIFQWFEAGVIAYHPGTNRTWWRYRNEAFWRS